MIQHPVKPLNLWNKIFNIIFFEKLQSHSRFLIETKALYDDNLQGLYYFIKGYHLSQVNKDIYADLEPIAFKTIETVYSEDVFVELKNTLYRIDNLVSLLNSSVILENDSMNKQIVMTEDTVSQLYYLGMKIGPASQQELTLYNLFVYFNHVLDQNSEADILSYLNELDQLITTLENDLQ